MLQLPDLRISDNARLVLDTAACFVVVAVIVRAYLFKSDSGLPLPPSPPSRRLLGHFVPDHQPFLTVAGWLDEYGPLITIRLGTERVVVIGRHNWWAIQPPLTSWGQVPSDAALHAHLQPKAAEEYQPLQMSHAKNTVLSILEDPSNFQNHVGTHAATVITKVAYGKSTPTSATDPEVKRLREHMRVFRTTLRPGAYLVDSIPWLKYLPWYGRELKRAFQDSKQLYTTRLNRVKQQIQSNEDVGPSFAKYMLQNIQYHNLTEIEMAFLAGGFFVAGIDTTTLSICTIFMAAALFPEEQAKVQAELDAIVGRHRAPTFADEKSLPRLHAFISETLRWRPMLPSGGMSFGHVIFELLIVRLVILRQGNYRIPAGTTVVGNHWSISRDPDVFPEPHAFKPERWINDQGLFRDDLKFFVYGFGRRACPGQYLANRSMFINTVLTLWAFQLTLDPTKPLNDMGYMSGASRPCTIEFKTRIPETELRRMMQNYPEVA
ncbi:cytochrome P450 [Suillus paluster]|uniref:cytochrome P450 n=1 Tax=Suillus paluster TaxID=48578 RepID=UPI001B8709C4|nr:cytochrome P450 [Suillus paluster]KAG1748503.1 cytochrome P450 [Suillus paluster]